MVLQLAPPSQSPPRVSELTRNTWILLCYQLAGSPWPNHLAFHCYISSFVDNLKKKKNSIPQNSRKTEEAMFYPLSLIPAGEGCAMSHKGNNWFSEKTLQHLWFCPGLLCAFCSGFCTSKQIMLYGHTWLKNGTVK